MRQKNNWNGKHGPLLIAEIGGNHEGDFDYAKKLTHDAISTDVDYIKFQIYDGKSLVNKIIDEKRFHHFNKFKLSIKQYHELAKICVDNGKKFMASIWSNELIEDFDKYIDVYKVGSGDLNSVSILKQLALIGKPIIISTGLSNFSEVKNSITFLRSKNQKYNDPNFLSVLQCTSMYPIEHCDAHLNVMKTFKEEFKVSVGYSDHTVDLKALKYAFCLGAEVLEFHFTDSRENKQFRDHKVSLIPLEIQELISEIKLINTLKGNKNKTPLKIEIKNGHVESFRRGVYLNKDINGGEKIDENNLIALRPMKGLSAENFYDLVGLKACRDIKAYEPLKWDYFK